MKIGLLLISTGGYNIFIDPLLSSIRRHFMPGGNVEIVLFTDRMRVLEKNVTTIYKEHESWPYITLKRFRIFSTYEEIIRNYDYLYYCDIDMLFVSSVSEEIIGNRVATIHPGFLGGKGTPERRQESRACILNNEENTYFAGGFFGGSSSEFIKMSTLLSAEIDEDLYNGIIAVHNDESHLNRYYMNNPPDLVLSPSYCYPETWVLPFRKKILALNKNHMEVRRQK